MSNPSPGCSSGLCSCGGGFHFPPAWPEHRSGLRGGPHLRRAELPAGSCLGALGAQVSSADGVESPPSIQPSPRGLSSTAQDTRPCGWFWRASTALSTEQAESGVEELGWPWQYNQRSPRPANPCLPLPPQVSLQDPSLVAGGTQRARSSVSTAGLSTGFHGRAGPGEGAGRLTSHSTCAPHICPTRSATAEPLAPGDTGPYSGSSAPSIPTPVSAKDSLFHIYCRRFNAGLS